ncbi:hypothetical protein CPC08DRAFT_480548 [Agrocybe pediades]|nr:hypothetical protein CPC08DRAFT_480548 [Agrocybe pediades]
MPIFSSFRHSLLARALLTLLFIIPGFLLRALDSLLLLVLLLVAWYQQRPVLQFPAQNRLLRSTFSTHRGRLPSLFLGRSRLQCRMVL